MQRRTFTTALVLTADEGLSKEFAADVAMMPEEAEQIASLSETVCLQYNFLGQHAPAVFLLMAVGGYGTKVFLVLKKLEDLAKFNRQQDKANAAKPAKPGNPEAGAPDTAPRPA